MTGKSRVVGVLLAAGAGTRFGGDKLLAMLPDGTPMAVRSAQNLSKIVDEVLCVIRPQDEQLHGVLRRAGFHTVTCDDAEEGMGASFRMGIAASAQAEGWMIALADMPVVKEETYLKLRLNRTDEHIVVPIYQAQAGHPVWFPQRYRKDLLALKGDQGAKGVVQKHQSHVRCVSVRDAGVLQDFDTCEAFAEYFMEKTSLTI